MSQTPTWVHMDRRYGTPACRGTTAGYPPTLRRGSRAVMSAILRDALSTLGYQTGSRIDGIFGARTCAATRSAPACGWTAYAAAIAGKKISTAVIGIGRTKNHH